MRPGPFLNARFLGGLPDAHFQSHRFRKACREYGIKQEYITPYTPEQNGVVERFFRSLKEECV